MGCICGKEKKPAEEAVPTEAQITAELMLGTKPVFWIIGGPGSGKGTQCGRLAQRYGLAHLSSGDLLRAEVARSTELGKKLNEMMFKGQLVPRDIVLNLIKTEMIQCYSNVNGFLIDGYPREAIQGKDFEKNIGPCRQILYISCSDATMKKRLLKRAETSGRVDDNEETIENRLKVFHELSEPVIKEYAGITATIPGDTDPESVFKECSKYADQIITPLPST